MKTAIFILLFSLMGGFTVRAQPDKPSGDPLIVNLSERQVAALDVAMREMRKMKRSFRGQAIRIEQEQEILYVSFVDVPVDMRLAGGSNGITWEIRKRDLKVLRWTLPR